MSTVVRRALVGTVIALTVVVGVDLTLRWAEPYLPEPQQWPSGELAAKVAQMESLQGTSDIEVAFVGSSVAAEGLDPLAFRDSSGRLTYNAALSAASIRSVEVWVEGVVVPMTDPSIIVIGVTGRDLNDNGISQSEFYERLTNAPGITSLRKPDTLADHIEDWFYRNSALLRLRPLLSDPTLLFSELGLGDPGQDDDSEVGPFGSDTSYSGGGYADLSEWRAVWLARHLNDYSIGDAEVEALERLLKTLTAKGIAVLVVNMPVTSDYVESLPDTARDAEEFDVILEETVSEAGAAYFDASDLYEVSDFRDPAHLKPSAASDLARHLARLTSSTSTPSDEL